MDPNYSQPPYDFEDDNIDIKRYLSLFISNWYWFAIALFISLSIAYGINRYSGKTYTVSSTLLIKDDQLAGSISGAEAFIPGGEYFKNNQNLRNEIGILKSYSINKRVIDSLPDFHIVYVAVGRRNIAETRLYKDSPFIVVPNSGKKQPAGIKISVKINSNDGFTLSINGDLDIARDLKFGDLFEAEGFSFRIYLRDPERYKYDEESSNKYLFWFASPEGLANQYRNKLSINPIDEEASLVVLTLSGPVARQEADYLNMLMELYRKQGVEFKNETAEKTIEFIDNQLGVISDSLINAENKLEFFRLSNRVVDLSTEASLLQNRLEEYESERIGIKLKAEYYNYLKEYIASKKEDGDIVSPAVMGITDPQLLKLVQDLALLQKEKRSLSLNLVTESTPIGLMDDDIERVKSALIENVNGGISRINSSLSEVNSRILAVENEIKKLPGTERQMINIQRKFDVNNTVYTYLLEKRAEAGIAKASNVSDNRIIDNAYVFNSSMVKPKPRKNYMMALLFGLFIPAAGILLIDYLNNRIIDKKDVEKGTSVPVIGYISHNDKKSELPVYEKPGSTLAESFRSVRMNMKFFTKDIANPVIAVSSTISGEGKTFISVNLATIVALLGKKVLLIGLDLRKPRIHRVLNVDNSAGISTYLAGSNSYKDIINKTEIENLFYAPSGPVPPNPAELIESPGMKKFIEKAKEEFDYIIIDTPPIAIVTDALLLAPLTDIYLMVVRQRYTSKNTLQLIEELNRNKIFKSICIAINDISLTGYYGYGLRYGYSMGYGYNYGYNYYGNLSYGRYGYSDKAHGYYTDE